MAHRGHGPVSDHPLAHKGIIAYFDSLSISDLPCLTGHLPQSLLHGPNRRHGLLVAALCDHELSLVPVSFKLAADLDCKLTQLSFLSRVASLEVSDKRVFVRVLSLEALALMSEGIRIGLERFHYD